MHLLPQRSRKRRISRRHSKNMWWQVRKAFLCRKPTRNKRSFTMFKSDKSKAVAAMFMAFMQCILLTFVICIKPQYELYICALVCQILCFLPVAYYQVKYQHQFPDLLMCICVCSITVREMVGLWRPELSEIASKIQCVIAFVYFISAFRKAFCRTNELQSMVDEMKRQNNVRDSDSPADAGEGEKDEGNDGIRD